ncbi:MAG: hypothetical protein A3A33_01135 [Candidatus Yanofskybacteria bacterium RIFCSPLOWO2_01_FULL_49_25]|uniref:Uncharacterized protein n=1 Tax=Candidatus Yanofskybacteria bacterium RIFCSPLOWO2_01_FULL_49_25 TaxID=1802701 RepID=A0A1F8GVD7_9BACT|nr:MAG: hypothetical protein A3A33_01135 [Candidatus Yanofskybacteria bacterium RIFCSPLOWO2_01_FULL_49_25]
MGIKERTVGFAKEWKGSLKIFDNVDPEVKREKMEERLAELQRTEKEAEAALKPEEELWSKEYLQHAWAKQHVKRLEKGIEDLDRANPQKIFSRLVEGARVFADLRMIRSIIKYLGSISFDYFAVQHQRSKTESVAIDTPLDEKIPFSPERLQDYLRYIPFWIASIVFIKKEFGKSAGLEMEKILTDMAGFYSESGVVFRDTQTHFGGRSDANTDNTGVDILQLIDKNKNLFPSLHAEVVAHVYSRIEDTIDKYAEHPEDYEQVRENVKQNAVRIMEACLLIKQHGWQDLSAGLAIISARDANFTPERAKKLIDAMFTNADSPVDADTAREIRGNMLALYTKLFTEMKQHRPEDYTAVLIKHLKELKQTSSI